MKQEERSGKRSNQSTMVKFNLVEKGNMDTCHSNRDVFFK